ncbi:MAG: DUF1512 family protein [Candidatus Aenigmarchaeota archaeon]|nr:DUF1512 family protein [Candidatus Aenigmarchaeota archaeon]
MPVENVLFQFGLGLDGNPLSFVLSFVLLVVFFLFYPRIMLIQIMWKLEKTVKDLETMSNESKVIIMKEISPKPDKRIRDSVGRFYDFFMISPVSLDTQGIVRKIEHLVKGQRERFRYFVGQVAPKMPEEKRTHIEMGLAGGITLYEITKVVRHYVEIVKKTKSFQIAMILQMQLPLVERMARSIFKGTKVMAKGMPIGDALGPYVVARLIGSGKTREVDEDIILSRKEMDGRDVFLMKAKGPGGRLGRPGLAIHNLMKEHKIQKIISIDAAAKLEGEKTGSVAEGVGVAMGGIGVERNYIEEAAVKSGIPLDSIIVKMSSEEAIEPLKRAIISAYPKVIESIGRSLENVKKGSKVLIVGVGNTCGVGNSQKGVEDAEKWVEKYERQLKAMKKKSS